MTVQSSNRDANGQEPRVRFVPLAYDGAHSEESARQLILAVRPEWAGNDSRIEFVRFTDGITNTLLKAVNKREGLSKEEADSEAILLRAYGAGTDLIIDRERETQNHELLMMYNLAPQLIARFANGMLYRYIRGSVTSPEDLRKPHIYNAVAERLANWHAVVPCIPDGHPDGANGNGINGTNGSNGADNSKKQSLIHNVAPGKPYPNMWTVVQKWILALPTATEEQQARQNKLQTELDSLVKQLSQRPGLGNNGLVFAHCDLLSGNVIVMPSHPQAEGATKGSTTVHFIDYEYAVPSPAAFDISNHFAEWAGFDCDFGALPTVNQRKEFIRHYVESYYSHLPGATAKNVDIETETNKLIEEVNVFRGLPGYYWGIWALIQATISDIDFDYASYAEIRLGEYWAWKAEEDGSRAAAGQEKPLRERRWAQLE